MAVDRQRLVYLPSIFRKLAGLTLPFTLTLTVLLQRNTCLFPLLLLSLALNAAQSSIPFGRIKRYPKAWWSTKMEEAVSARRKAFAVAHRSDEDRQAYISASRLVFLFRPNLSLNPFTLFFALTLALLPSLPTSPLFLSQGFDFGLHRLPEIPLFYLSARGPAQQSQRLPLRATCSEESHSSFYSPFFLAEFLAAASNSSSIGTGLDKVAYSMLKHLPPSGMVFYTFSFFLELRIPFLPSGKHLPLFPSTKWESLSTLLLPSGQSLSPHASQSFLNASCYPVYSSIWNLNCILFLRLGRSILDEILYLSQSISDGFNKPRPGSETILYY